MQYIAKNDNNMTTRLGDAFAAIKAELHPGSATDKAVVDLLNRQSYVLGTPSI